MSSIQEDRFGRILKAINNNTAEEILMLCEQRKTNELLTKNVELLAKLLRELQAFREWVRREKI